MIAKVQRNMAILDEELNYTEAAMDEMPTNLSLDKTNTCDNANEQEQSCHGQQQDSLSEKEKKCLSENVKDFPNETRIQLSFSVDRLLNHHQTTAAKHHHQQQQQQKLLHCSDKCCEEVNNGYSCCSMPNCMANTVNPTSLSFTGNTFQNADEDFQIGPSSNFMDYKSVVRPTPMRAVGNNTEQVQTLAHFSPLTPSTLIRIHHAQLQQQKQLASHIPAQQNFTLSSLMGPLCSMKPMETNVQQIGLQNFAMPANTSNRFAAKTSISFDIPGVRPNLTCISNLRHHHLGSSTSNETHLSFASANSNAVSVQSSSGSGNSTSHAHSAISNGKRKRSWSRAVFSNLQRKGLEIQFQQQKYITKPDRRKLAARLNLTDAQVKVWFQNRRMKWRHTRENLKSGQEKQPPTDNQSNNSQKASAESADHITGPGYSSDGSSSLELSDADEDDDEDEIDVVE